MTTCAKLRKALTIVVGVAMPFGLLQAKPEVQATQVTQASPAPDAAMSPPAPAAETVPAGEMVPDAAIATPFGRIAEYVRRIDCALEAREKEASKSFAGDSSKSSLLDMIAAGSDMAAKQSGGDPSQENAEIVTALQEQAAKLRKTVAEIEHWQKQLGRVQGRGAVDEMMAKAEQWNLECRYRRELHAQSVELIACVEKLMLLRLMEIREDRQALATLLDVLKTEQGKEKNPAVAAVEDVSGLDNGFEYYEVKEDATLREISALPAVYSDPRLWHRLYAANRDRVPDLQADRNVPSGTILLVPGLLAKRNYDF